MSWVNSYWMDKAEQLERELSAATQALKQIAEVRNPETLTGSHLNDKNRAQLAFAAIDNVIRIASLWRDKTIALNNAPTSEMRHKCVSPSECVICLQRKLSAEREVREKAEEALREIEMECGNPDPSDGEGTSPQEVVQSVTGLKAKLARVLEDRARFPDKPDGIGEMIAAHIGNLKNAARHHEDAWRRVDTEKDYAEANLSIAREALERICDKAMDFMAVEIAREALDKIK